MFNQKRKDLVLAIYSNDGEFGCGGTIAKFINEGHNVYYALSEYQQSVLPQFPLTNSLVITSLLLLSVLFN